MIVSNSTYRVGDDENLGVGSSISSGLGEVTDDGSVSVEEILTIRRLAQRSNKG